MKLSVIVPAYNEARTLQTVVDAILAVELGDVDCEILIVNDGSTDDTGKVADELAAKHSAVTVAHQIPNQGKGAAVSRGIAQSDGDYVLVQDADLELSPTEYPVLLKPVLDGGAVVVYGSRFLRATKGSYLGNRSGNYGLTMLTNLLYGSKLTDMATGYKLMRRDLFDRIRIESRGFDMEPELTAKFLRLGVSIVEVAVSYTPRTTQQGKKLRRFHDGWQYVKTLWRYRRFQPEEPDSPS